MNSRARRSEIFGEQARRRIAELVPATGLLQELRAAGAAAFAASELPTNKTESWKYSRIGPLLETGLLDRAAPGATAPARAVIRQALHGACHDARCRVWPACYSVGFGTMPWEMA